MALFTIAGVYTLTNVAYFSALTPAQLLESPAVALVCELQARSFKTVSAIKQGATEGHNAMCEIFPVFGLKKKFTQNKDERVSRVTYSSLIVFKIPKQLCLKNNCV